MNAQIILKLLDGVTGPIKKVQSAIGEASKKMQEFSERADKAFERAEHIKIAGEGVRDFAEKSREAVEAMVKPFEELEHSLNRVEAASGASKEQMEEIEAAARKVGQSGRAGASEAAAAMEQMVQSGFKVQQAMDVLPTMLDRAKVANVSLAEATQGATDTAKKFGLSLDVDVLTHLNDLTAKMALASGSSFQKMNDALLESGAAAKLAGVSVERTAQMVGLLSQKGIQGGAAGEALNVMFRRLSNATVLKNLQGIGIKTTEMVDGVKKARDPLAIMSDAMEWMTKKGYDQEKQQAILNQLFGRSAAPVRSLLKAMNEPGASKLAEALKDVNGVTKEMAETDLKNGIDKSRALQGALENLGTSIGKTMAPRMDAMKEKLAGIVINMTEWIEKNPGLAEGLGIVAGGVTAVATALAALTTVTTTLLTVKGVLIMAGGWAQFGATMAAIAAPVLAVSAAILGLSAAVYELHKHWDELTSLSGWKDYFKGVAGSIGENGVLSTVGQMFNPSALMQDIGQSFSSPSAQPANGSVDINVKGPATGTVNKGSQGLTVNHDVNAGVPMLGGG